MGGMTDTIAKSVPFGTPEAEPVLGPVGPLTARLKADLTAAMKARDEQAKSVLRMALAALQNAEVAGKVAKRLTEDEELAVITREVRQRKESAETYDAAGRAEMAAQEAAEAEFLSKYLPAPLTDDELAALVDQAVADAAAELGEAPTMKQMGAIVKAVNEQVKGRAEGSKVAALVRARLA
jgi:uncharacterized protein YqeY